MNPIKRRSSNSFPLSRRLFSVDVGIFIGLMLLTDNYSLVALVAIANPLNKWQPLS